MRHATPTPLRFRLRLKDSGPSRRVSRTTSAPVQLAACVLSMAAWMPAFAQAPPADAAPPERQAGLLAEATFVDPVYGVSLRLPTGAVQRRDHRAGTVAAWDAPGDVTLIMSIYRSEERLPVRSAFRGMMGEVSFSQQEVQIDDQERWGKVAGRAGVSAFFKIAQPRTNPQPGQETVWQSSLGLALVQMDPQTILSIEIRGPMAQHDTLQGTLAQMMDHLTLASPQEVARQMNRLTSEGHVWRLSVTPEQRRAGLPGEPVLFRVLQDGQDVGFMKLERTELNGQTLMGEQGLAIRVKGTERLKDGRIDRDATYFEGADGASELWSVKSSLRQTDTAGRPITRTWTETGTRSDRAAQGGKADKPRREQEHVKPVLFNRINVEREGSPPPHLLAHVRSRGAGRVKLFKNEAGAAMPKGYEPVQQQRSAAPTGELVRQMWTTPPQAYLSQVDLWTVLMFMPPQKQAERLAFYAYDPGQAEVTLHLMNVEPQGDGTSQVVVKPSLDSPARTYHFDAAGRLTRVDLPAGRQWVVTTPRELQARWRHDF